MMRIRYLLVAGSLLTVLTVFMDRPALAQEGGPLVLNVRAAQRPHTNLVDIHYDLITSAGHPATVSASLSVDGGQTYPIACTTVTGDVGPDVAPGFSRHIVWDAGIDYPAFDGDDCRIRVAANAGPDGNVMVQIPGATFRMGDDSNYCWVYVGSFYVSRMEVTQAQYAALMPYTVTHPMRPAVDVTWYQAIQYCNALSIQEGLTPAYEGGGSSWTWNRDADGYRLLTESEWEYACRAGSQTHYCNGDTEADLALVGWYSGNSGNRAHDVQTKAPNAWEIYDMHGNVWEWCWDWYAGYPSGTTPENPHIDDGGPSTGTNRVRRGGAFGNDATYCRSAYRINNSPGYSYNNLGFRLARSAF